MRVSGSLTVADLRFNQLDTGSATMLANIAKEKKISLCGITPEQTFADLRPRSQHHGPYMGPADAILLTADLTVRGSLASIGRTGMNLKGNKLGAEGWGAIFAAVCSSPDSKITSIDASGEMLGVEGAKAVGKALQESISRSLAQVRLRFTLSCQHCSYTLCFLFQVDLSSNSLGGYYLDDGDDRYGDDKQKFISDP